MHEITLSRRQVGQALAAAATLVSVTAPAKAECVQPLRVSSHFTASSPVLYFDVLEPPQVSRPTVLMVHGGAHSGACYLETADSRPGWAQYFAAHGHRVVVPDWPGCGRSGAIPATRLDGHLVCAGIAGLIESLGDPVILLVHSMSGAFGWKLIETCGDRISKLVAIAPAPPGNIQEPAEIVSRGDSFIEVRQAAGCIRLSKTDAFIPPDGFADHKLIGSGTQFPRETVDRYKRSLLAVPPRLVIERTNVEGRQLRVTNPANYRGKPVLMVVGTQDLDHPVEFDRKTYQWLVAQGSRATFLPLGSRGLSGNGHMMMLERNSDAIAALLVDWANS